MRDPVMADLDRYLASQENAERLWEATCEWIEGGGHYDHFEDDEAILLSALVRNGPETHEDDLLWERAEAAYFDSCSPY